MPKYEADITTVKPGIRDGEEVPLKALIQLNRDDIRELRLMVEFLLDNTYSVWAGRRITMRELYEIRGRVVKNEDGSDCSYGVHC